MLKIADFNDILELWGRNYLQTPTTVKSNTIIIPVKAPLTTGPIVPNNNILGASFIAKHFPPKNTKKSLKRSLYEAMQWIIIINVHMLKCFFSSVFLL